MLLVGVCRDNESVAALRPTHSLFDLLLLA